METVYFSGNECHTYGSVPAVGSVAPEFSLVDTDLKELTLESFPGKKIVLTLRCARWVYASLTRRHQRKTTLR